MTIDEFICLQEAKLSTKARNKLDDEQFGIPELRKYPLTDRKHVLQAVRFFNKAEEKYKPELARNIVKRAKELNMDWENWDVLKPYLDKKYNESFLYEEYADELNAPKEANELCEHLSAYKYDNQSPKTWRLKSPEEVDKLKKGNCHDTAWYVYNKLDSYADKKVGKGILFFIEYKEGKKEGGSTHSVCYEKIPGGICVIECSWHGMTGTFPYNNIDEYIAVVNKNWNFTKGCNKLFATDITNISNIHSGMTLGEYVDNAIKNKEIIVESFVGDDDDDYEVHEPDDCYCESADSNGITNAKLIASRIHEKVKKDSKPPTGNQNCMLCTMCAEAQFRGRTDMPRPVYSPRDPVLNILGESIVIHPRNYSLKSGFDDMLDILTENPDARFYCHVKWKNGNGGHEFLIITENGKAYIMDPQQGTFDKFLENHPYIKDLKWDESYLARMDNAEFNETVLRDFNTPESVVPWDAKLDIPYMLKHGMLSEEEAEQYWKEHPDEASKDRHFLSYEELDKMSGSKNIFTSGDFAKYGKDVDLDKARGPIQESAWNDIKNGVNPHSKKLWFHVSRSDKHEGKTFEPRVPNYLYTQKELGKDDPYYEDMKIPRICFSPSIEGALHAIISMGDRIGTAGDEFYVYIPEKPINEYKHMTNKEIVDKKLVFDAKYTKECWITEPVKLILYGSIVIDQVYNHRTKPTANNQGRVGVVSYKWHWQTKPQVVKGTGHEAFAWNDGSNNNGKSKKDKSIKEAFDMSDFTRNPSVYKMFLEAEDSTEEETKEETMNETEVEIGSDISDIQNQYNAKDVETLNHLISSEADAISDYFEGSKNTKNPILTKLFSDIGEEERFHIEQLLFAKATLTGEKYEPRDPKVKKEYEELVELGMDEETAMTTAVDKLSISTKTEIGDGDDEEITDEKIEEMEDIAESFNMMTQLANATSFQTETILEAFADNTDVRVSLYETTNAFFEQAIFMEEVENLSTREGQKALGTKSPIKIIFNAFRAVYRIIIDIVKKIKLTFQKIRLRDKRRWQWIKRHGIKGLFQSGISMYFYSDKTNKFEVSDPLKYLILIHEINTKIVKDCGLNVNLTFDVDSFINMLTKNSPNSNLNIDVDKMRVKTIADGINLLRGVTLQKTKIIVTDANEAMLEDQFFGYTEEKYKMIENDENNTKINLSNNVYNQMGIIADALKALGIETENIIKELNNLEGTGDKPTVYSTNQNLYKLCVNSMGVITKSVNKFTAAVSSDISTMLNVNNGLMQAMQNADKDENNKSEVAEYLKGRDQASVSKQEDENEVSPKDQPARKPARQI